MSYKKGSLFIISAPSGAGKTSLVKALLERFPDLSVSVSHTTRKPRTGEVDGKDYYFVDEPQFRAMINDNQFLEYARVFDNYYGTSRQQIEEDLKSGTNIILEIDWQGARQIKSLLRSAVGIFVLPPDYDALRERLANRHTDDSETVENRMQQAREEISHYKEYDYVVINDDFDDAVNELAAIVTATNLGSCRQSAYYDDFVGQMMAHED
ncbi:MAG: guanylate kinase [Gammaproteobacteria bacterium]